MSAGLAEGAGISSGIGGPTMVLVAFAARGRRLLRSAYRLLDAEERDTAAPLFRVMNEYLIVSRWVLQADDDDLKLWALNDLRGRLTVINEVLADTELNLEGDQRAEVEAERLRTEEAIVEHGGQEDAEREPERCPTCNRVKKGQGRRTLTLEAMAKSVGLGFVYSFSYRLQSKNDVHATPLAVDNVYDTTDEGLVIRPMPRYSLESYDSYAVGAHLLLDLLAPLAERMPELGWQTTHEMVRETLAANTKAALAADTSD
jgi:hypothetical protein